MKTPQIAALPSMTPLGLPIAETAHHTPGPWRIGQPKGDGSARIIWRNDEGPGFAGETNTNYRMVARDIHSEANARLIAAAPDMLAALRQWAVAERMGDAQITQGARASRDAAIAKAEGR